MIFQEDPLYMSYAFIVAKSCGEEEEEGGDEEEEGEEGGASIHVSINKCTYVCTFDYILFFSYIVVSYSNSF